jgi:hypothetical protein
MALTFKWDGKKAKQNVRKHSVSFEEATTVFMDTLSLTIADPIHSDYEERFIIIGESIQGRLLVVVHTENNDNIRIISARIAKSSERRTYEKGNY